MYDEDDLLPISALQHLAFCERQWGLIHLEGIWTDNPLTVEGQHLHERVHHAGREARCDLRIARGLRLRSLRLGLTGKADVVEFRRLSEALVAKQPQAGTSLPGVTGLWEPRPVEYKRGRPKLGRCDEVQLCAQTLCLEEMLGVTIGRGALFYGRSRRRCEVVFDSALRGETERLALRLHQLSRAGQTPPPTYGRKCKSCSLLSFCLPKVTGGRRRVERYLAAMTTGAVGEGKETMV